MFRVPEKLYSTARSIVAFWVYAVEELNPLLLAFADKIGRNVPFDDPPVKISFPAETLDFFVDELFAASVLTNALIHAFLTGDADVVHVGFFAPEHVNGEEYDLTFNIFFVMIHA